MPVNPLLTPSARAEQAKKALMIFYQKPVAQVSTELFFTIGAIIFFALGAIRPTIVTMTELVKEIEDKQKLTEALSKKVTTLASVSTQYFSLQEELPILDEIIPQTPKTSDTLKIIEKLAGENKVEIISIAIKDIPVVDDNEIPFKQKKAVHSNFSVTVQGGFEAIRPFIQALTTLRPLFTIDDIRIAKNENEKGGLITTLEMNAYYYANEAQLNPEEETSSDSVEETSEAPITQ